MGRLHAAAATTVLVVLALLGGIGTVYAPGPTSIVVAGTFALGLWWFARDGRWSFAWRKPPIDAEANGKPRSTLITKLVSAYLLVWWLALIAPIATYSPRGGAAELGQGAAGGSLRNQLLIISFGLVGSLFLPAAIRRFDPVFRWAAALWALYLCWAFASLLWSDYAPLTIRNTIALTLVTAGSVGLGGGFYGNLPNGRELFVRHILVMGVMSALVVLIPLPFRWDQYDLLDPAGRLEIGGGFTTYVARPVVCALLLLVATAILGIRGWHRRDWFLVATYVLPLLALKTRGPVLWALLALAIFLLFYKSRVQDRILQAGMLIVIGLGAYLYFAEGLFTRVIPYLVRGDIDVATRLTGRIPLWQTVLPEIADRPWLGAGFAAFWNPERSRQLELQMGGTAPSAHNGYLEELLNTGIVGLAILLAFCVSAMVVARRRARLGDQFGWLAILFLVFYLLLNLTNALVQEALNVPFMIILASLALMANSRIRAAPRRAAAAVRRQVAYPR